ncbi:hypothetical protein MMB17_17765 [Methylobacterium organophilum]|uniref:hypothetical protein n=1 Tax=Methylobacterium organophilum TaxID=410 RepID=UPI001F13B2DA|nr:hypothetical protein [Methylobacterium organophilum]UMY16526.1 hypothetical protein MMB17_17765 [Methylobacterium organophilum]
MFEVTGDDIAALSDGDLRALINLLCEAELRRRGLHTTAVTAGGDQDAPDGGVDVRVALPPETTIGGFIPRPATVYQSKKSDMKRAAILKEMRPSDTLRPAIVALAEEGGAYVIVSSGAKTADRELTSRRMAMKEALHGIPSTVGLTIDFYDQTRVATWVRDHPALTLWVRARIGRSLGGWRPFGRWSSQPPGADPAYLLDDAARVRTSAVSEGNGLSAADGIERMRVELREPRKSVRLVGLSGVGKTRLAEALFDSSVGNRSLDPSLAFYADIGDEPDPSPVGLVSDLIANRTRAILVIDNCPPGTHRRLTEIVKAEGSTVSLLTIEYDIQDGEPEGTDVFILETSSPAIIEQLLVQRFPSLSQVDVRTIADFSGGNARIALALAEVAPRSGTVASLGDKELFRRLFEQRDTPDTSLLPIAQVCALLYSFEGEALDGDDAELPILGSLIGRTAEDVRTAAIKLKRRQLVQARGPWRAVLPHAVANRLATTALEEIPRFRLMAALAETATDRVLRSFSRRLGYLDASEEARDIVRSWLAPGGLLADITHLNELGIAVLTNVAPVAPDAALAALETAIYGADDDSLRRCTPFVRLLRALAYEPAYFERAAALLVQVARLPKENHLGGDAAEILESLFPIRLSGTRAPLELRLTVVGRLLRSTDESEQHLGVRLLRAVLRTEFFTSGYNFEFGARSRDYGLHPRNGQEIREWYGAALGLAAPFLYADGPVSDGVRDVIARAFRGLWVRGGQAAELTRLIHAIVGVRGFWRDGWIAVRQTRIYDGDHLPPDTLAELGALEDALRPRTTIDKVRHVVLHGGGHSRDLDDPVEDDDTGTHEITLIKRLAQEIVSDDIAFQDLLPDLAEGDSYKVGYFGESLADMSEALRTTWDALVAHTAATSKPGIAVLCGFLIGVERRDAALARALLDEALENPVLAPFFPILQSNVAFDDAALARLHHALATGVTPVERFARLAYGSVSSVIAEPELKRLLVRIAEIEGGNAIARQILHMRFYLDRGNKREIGPDLVETGRALLSGFQFERERRRPSLEDHELALMVRVSLAGEGGRSTVRNLCQTMMQAMARYEIGHYEYDDLMQALFEVHPIEMLDTLFSGDEISRRRSAELLNELPRPGKIPMNAVSDDVVLAWCSHKPAERFPLAAAFVQLYERLDKETPLSWTGLVRHLLSNAPDPLLIFDTIVERLRPTSWSGSLAMEFALRLDLLERLDIAALPVLTGPMERARETLRARVERARQSEQAEARERDSRFE